MTGKTLKVITDFLLERSFRVRIGESLSDIFDSLTGLSVGTTVLPDIHKRYSKGSQEFYAIIC